MNCKRLLFLLMLLALIYFLFSLRALHAQTTYNVKEAPGCTWDKNTESDLAGYRLYLVRFFNPAVLSVLIGTSDTTEYVTGDNIFFVPDSMLIECTYEFGVSAFDVAGNESEINWAVTQCERDTLAPCWNAVYDITKPAVPCNLTPPF